MRVTKPYRGQRPVKRLDLTDMRKLFRETRNWCAIGRVFLPPGATSHFEVTDDDILVDVILQPSLTDVTCRLAAGMWLVPDVGEEVVVAIPEGEITFMPTVIGVLSTGNVPTAQGPTPQRIAIVRPEVVVHDGTGGANALPTLDALEQLKQAIIHWTPVANDGGAALKTALIALFTGPPTWPYSTTVLKGK